MFRCVTTNEKSHQLGLLLKALSTSGRPAFDVQMKLRLYFMNAMCSFCPRRPFFILEDFWYIEKDWLVILYVFAK